MRGVPNRIREVPRPPASDWSKCQIPVTLYMTTSQLEMIVESLTVTSVRDIRPARRKLLKILIKNMVDSKSRMRTKPVSGQGVEK